MKFLAQYRTEITDLEWMAFGLTAEFVRYKQYEPVCEWLEDSDAVYFILEGDIAILPEKRTGSYHKDYIEEHSVNRLKPGGSLGELRVIYGENR